MVPSRARDEGPGINALGPPAAARDGLSYSDNRTLQGSQGTRLHQNLRFFRALSHKGSPVLLLFDHLANLPGQHIHRKRFGHHLHARLQMTIADDGILRIPGDE